MHVVISCSYAVLVTGKVSEKAVYLWKRTNKNVGMLLTSDSTGSHRIWDY